MRKRNFTYRADQVVHGIIRHAAASSLQDFIIGCEVLFAAGLASRELTLVNRERTLIFKATRALASRLEILTAPSTKLD